jgi:hypothetical protein
MKSSLPLLILLSLVACGQMEPPKTDAIMDDLVPSAPQAISIENPKVFARITAVCDALRAKEDFLRDPARNQRTFIMDLDHQDCSGTTFPGRDLGVRINARAGKYNFEYTLQQGVFTPIPAVESRDDGIMEEICDKGASMISPMPITDSDASALIITAFDNVGGCVSDDKDTACIYVARGNYSEDKKFIKVHERHYIEFRLTGEFRGFYTKRSLVKNCLNSDMRTTTIQSFK